MNTHKYKVTKENDLVTLAPITGRIKQTLIFLHGWGQSGSEWVDYFIQGNATPDQTKIVLPTAPIRHTTFYQRKDNAWFDFYTLKNSQEDTSKIGNIDHMHESSNIITKILDKEVDEIGDSRRCIIGGFSQGAFISSLVWKNYPKPLGGLIIYSGSADKNTLVGEAQENSPVFYSQGLEDRVFLHEHGIENNMNLDNGKRKFVYVTREGLGHGVDNVTRVKTKAFIEEVATRPKL